MNYCELASNYLSESSQLMEVDNVSVLYSMPLSAFSCKHGLYQMFRHTIWPLMLSKSRHLADVLNWAKMLDPSCESRDPGNLSFLNRNFSSVNMVQRHFFASKTSFWMSKLNELHCNKPSCIVLCVLFVNEIIRWKQNPLKSVNFQINAQGFFNLICPSFCVGGLMHDPADVTSTHLGVARI